MMQLLDAIMAFWNSIPAEVQTTLGRYLIALILLAVLIFASRWQGIGIADKLVIGTIRGTIQIILMGLILLYIFALRNLVIIFGVLTFMAFFAAHTVRGNLEDIPGVFKATLPGVTVGPLSVMFITVLLGIIEPIGEYIIPMGGMVIGNSMTLSTLVIERMWSNAQKQRSLLETALALGASPFEATEFTVQESIRSGLLPNLNRYASLGIVSIPGLMSGMIIGGENPVVASLYQVIVFIMIFLAAIIAGSLVSRMFLKEMFNERMQITVPPPEA
ncbi:iron export ABC transporter permease subunit FetB [Candidatus Thorarchaeota archaeon]|nr:MAG: iron export ABC transporter permease subunit FetB [Candidatus Thorarchaeota archaeon]